MLKLRIKLIGLMGACWRRHYFFKIYMEKARDTEKGGGRLHVHTLCHWEEGVRPKSSCTGIMSKCSLR